MATRPSLRTARTVVARTAESGMARALRRGAGDRRRSPQRVEAPGGGPAERSESNGSAAEMADSLGARMGPSIHAEQALPGGVRVDLRGGERRVPEQLLHREQIRAPFEQMRGERVPQRVRGQASRARRDLERLLHEGLDRTGREPPPAGVHEERPLPRTHDLEAAGHVAVEGPEGGGRHGHDPLLSALAQDAGLALPAIEVREVEPLELGEPESAPVEELQREQRPGGREAPLPRALLRRLEHGAGIPAAQVAGKPLVDPRGARGARGIGGDALLEAEEAEEAADGGELAGGGAPREAPPLAPAEEGAHGEPVDL